MLASYIIYTMEIYNAELQRTVTQFTHVYQGRWDSRRTDGDVDPVHLFLSLSSETEFELKKLSSTVGHCRTPYRQWPI